MAIGTITMILANVGLSIFNNWAGSRQNKQIAEKREEFERAAREGQRERMLQLMREGQQLTLELEEQKHKERLSELNDQFDNLIKELAYSAAIELWPLKTLPIVMKNQALGNLLANQEEKVALHCILTSSNCREFNDYVLPKVESALEAYCNVHWSTLTGSPVLFYSGAWKSNDVPTGTQVDSMRAALSNLPTLLITPFFRPQDHKLVFQVHVWGVGYNNSDLFTIPVIEPTEFQRDYTDELGWLAEEGLIEEAVEDIVPYLQCFIGYIADTYFWSAFGSVPQLPRMLTDGTINTDGMKYLVDDTRNHYSHLISEVMKNVKANPFTKELHLQLYRGINYLYNDEENQKLLSDIICNFCAKYTGKSYCDILDATNSLLPFEQEILVSSLEETGNEKIIDTIEDKRVQKVRFEDFVYLCKSIQELHNKALLYSNSYIKFYYQVVSEHSVIGCFVDYLGVSRCCVVIITNELKVDNETIKLDLVSKTFSMLSSDAIKRIGVPYHQQNVEEIAQKQLALYEDMICLGNTIEKSLTNALVNSVDVFSVNTDILNWGRKNKKSQDEELVLMRIIYKDDYYLIAIVTPFETIRYDKIITFKLCTIHPDIEHIMGDSTVKRIKI